MPKEHSAGDYHAVKERIGKALLTARGLTGAERQVGLLMLDHVNGQIWRDHGIAYCWPGANLLSRLSCLSESAVKKARARLKEIGAISVERPGGHGPCDTTRYAFDLTWVGRVEVEVRERRPDPPAGLRVDAGTPLASSTPAALPDEKRVYPCPAKGRQGGPIRVDASTPEPLDKNLLSKPSDRQQRKKAALQWGEGIQRACIVTGLPKNTVIELLMSSVATREETDEIFQSDTSRDRVAQVMKAIIWRCSAEPSGTAGSQ